MIRRLPSFHGEYDKAVLFFIPTKSALAMVEDLHEGWEARVNKEYEDARSFAEIWYKKQVVVSIPCFWLKKASFPLLLVKLFIKNIL